MDKYVKENKIKKIDFLKIDTDGFDFEVIKGCGKFLDKIKYIQFENWTRKQRPEDPPVTYYGGEVAEDIIKFFTDKGWSVYELWCPETNIMNYVATKKEIDFLPEYRK